MSRRTASRLATGGVLSALAATVLVLPAASGAAGAPLDPGPDSASSRSADTSSALVVLEGAPLAIAPGTRNARGRIDFRSARTRSTRAELVAKRNDFKRWLQVNAPAARVTNEFDLALHAVAVRLNGTPLSVLRSYRGTVEAQYETTYAPTATGPGTAADPDLPLVDAFRAWALAGGGERAGSGVKVAIIDSGIDVTHPCFSDGSAVPAGQLTNSKVVVAKVFYNRAAQQRLTPSAVDSHGTHVAGTVACNVNTRARVSGVAVPYGVSGVAPGATLGNYNVFPGAVASARSEDIVDAIEEAYTDGFDVANMSLGGDTHGARDLLANAVDNLSAAGMVFAISASNSGPGDATIGSPGSAAGAITAGASSVPHFVGSSLQAGGSSFPAAAGEFGALDADLTAPLAVVAGTSNGLSEACGALPSLPGRIAVVSRGTCSFSIKVRNAQSAGAVAVVVVNNVAGDPSVMGQDGTPDQPALPAFMVPLSASGPLAALDGTPATLDADLTYQRTDNEDILAGFSSVGPVDVTRRVKPDVVAPGVNVLSSIPAAHCDAPPCFAFFNGTSMAAPHVAGAAAVLLGERGSLTAEQVKGLITANAARNVVKDPLTGTSVETRVQAQGNGLLDVDDAMTGQVVLGPVSTTFGTVPSGAGQSRTEQVRVTNLGTRSVTVSASVLEQRGEGVTFTASPATSTLAAGATVLLRVTATVAKGAPEGAKQGFLVLRSGGAEVAHGAVFALVS